MLGETSVPKGCTLAVSVEEALVIHDVRLKPK